METQDKVVIGNQSGEGLQQQCVVCGSETPSTGPIPEDLKSLIEDLFNLLFDMDTLKGFLNWESGGLFLCKRCKPILEEAEEGTDDVILSEERVKETFQKLVTKVNLLKRTAESAATCLQRISNPKIAEAILDFKIEAGDIAGHFRKGIEKAKEKILLLLSSIKHGKLILNDFKPNYLSGALDTDQVHGEEEETTAEGPSTNNLTSIEEMSRMDSVEIDKLSGERRQHECLSCGTEVAPARPTDDCESTIESFFNLFFEKETMEELELSGVGNNDSLCTECKAKLEKAKEEAEKVILNEKAVNKTFVKLIEEVEYLKLGADWAISSFNCISNSNRLNDRLTDQNESENKTARFQRLMLKATEKLSIFRDSLKGGKLALDCFKPRYIYISSPSETEVEPGEIVETATQGPSGLNLRKSCLALRTRLSPSLRKSLSIADTSSRNTADLASAEENNVTGIEGVTESESPAASSLIAKRVTFGDVLILNEDEATSYETRTASSPSPEREIEYFHGPSLSSETEEFQDYNHSSEEDESPNIIKTEVEEEEELSTNWVNTNQSCFLCLQDSTEVKVIHLRSLLGHLQINEQEVYPDNDGNSRPVRNGEWDNILVDMCKSCGDSHHRLYTLLEQLEKNQMEIDNILEETNKSISESGRNRKLEESFFAKLGSNPRTPFNSEFVDNLRKRIAEKCKIMQSGQQLESTLESGIHEAFAGNESGSLGDVDSSSNRMEMLNKTGISVAQGNEEEPPEHFGLHSAASSGPAEENHSSGIVATVGGETESESCTASSLTSKRVGDVVTSSYAARTASSSEPETEHFSGPSLSSDTEEFQDWNHSNEEDVTMMGTCDDEVLIDSGDGQQKECLVCGADVPAGGPNGDNLKLLVRDFGELIFDSKTMDGLENCGNAKLKMCEICIKMLEEAKEGTEKIIVLERIVKDINRRLMEKVTDLKLTTERTVSSLKKISNSMGAEAMTTEKTDTGNKTGSDHFRRGILKSIENLSMYQKALNRGKLVWDCFKPDSLNLSSPSGMNIPSVLLPRLSLSEISLAKGLSSDTSILTTAKVATAQENHAGTAASVESDSESESSITPPSKNRKKRNIFRENEDESQYEESSQGEAGSNFTSKRASNPENESDDNCNGRSPSSEGENFQDRNTSSEESSDDEASSIRKHPGSASSISSAVSETNTVQQSSSSGESLSNTKTSSYYFKRSGMFHCKRCDKTVTSRPGIIYHFESVHLLNKKYKCDLCKVAVFMDPSNFTRHKKRCQKRIDKRLAREKDPKFKFICEVCEKRFDKKNFLSSHLLNVHRNVDRFPCDICEKTFKRMQNLRVHKDSVHFGKEYFCRFCKKKFGSKTTKYDHERSCSKKTTKSKRKLV